MDVMWFVLGLLLGAALAALVTWWIARLRAAAELARAEAQRDALAQRAQELAAVAVGDQQTARLLAPLRDTLDRVEGQVRALELDRREQLGQVVGQLQQVHRGTGELSRQTASLVESLRSSQTRGVWGEVQLRRVLEASGMLPRCDFDEQVVATTLGGRSVRPDVVVNLPGGKHLVLDAKAPAAAFLAAQAEGLEEGAAREHLAAHGKALRAHVLTLSGKEYWSALPRTAELVVCFVPSDAMLTAALAHDPSLHEDALARNVVLVGPAGLFALLKSVSHTWRQEALSRNAEDLLRLGTELHSRIGTMAGHTAALGKSLESGVKAYNAFLGSLESRVLVTARKIEELGVAGEKALTVTPVEQLPRPVTAPEIAEAG